MFCARCGIANVDAAHFCRKCGTQLAQVASSSPSAHPQIVIMKSAKSPGVAVILSFFWCGLGQIYNGQIGKGIIMMICYFVSCLLIFVLIGLLSTPILWIWGMVDAYSTAERLNAEMTTTPG